MPLISPILNETQFDNNGRFAKGWRIFTWLSGSMVKRNTNTDPDGLGNHTNPIELNSRGETPSPIFLAESVSYRLALCPPGTDDPPDVIVRDFDSVRGVGDAISGGIVEWEESGVTPVFVSATRFTQAGDQTSKFHVGRRLKFQTSAGSVYGEVSASVFTTITTVDVQMSLGVLDSGLTSVAYGINSAVNPSDPLDSRAILSPQTPLTNFENLIITRPSASTVSVFADKVVVRNSLGQAAVLENINLTLNLAASGINGLDTGAEAVSTGYFAWVIWDGTTKAGLLSANIATPTMPTGYTHKGLVGGIYNNSSGNLVVTDQRGRFVSISQETVLSLGSATAVTGVSLAAAIPPNVFRVILKVEVAALDAGATWGQVSSESSGGVQNSVAYLWVDAVSTPTVGTALALLRTSQTVWYKVADVNTDLTIDVMGYIW